MFIKFPENKPTEAGYHYCFYWNTEQQNFYCKCFWWNPNEDRWLWRFEPNVIAFIDVKHQYYCPCMSDTEGSWTDELSESIKGLACKREDYIDLPHVPRNIVAIDGILRNEYTGMRA